MATEESGTALLRMVFIPNQNARFSHAISFLDLSCTPGRVAFFDEPASRRLGWRNERRDLFESSLHSRSAIDLFVPSREMRCFVEVDTCKLAAPQPAEVNDISDGERIARRELALGQNSIEHG